MSLSDKRIDWHEEGAFYNSKYFEEKDVLTNGDPILRWKDVKQFIKEVLDELDSDDIHKFMIKDLGEDWVNGFNLCVEAVIDFIKQKAGDELVK